MPTPPPPPPYSARWQLSGKVDDKCPWSLGFHLALPTGMVFDFATVRRLHEDCLIWSEQFFFAVLSSGVTCDVSRMSVKGPASSIGDTLYTFANGARGAPVPSAIAVCVRQIIQASGSGRQGRFFLPPPAAGDVDFTFQLSPGAHSFYSTQLTTFFDGVNAISIGGAGSPRFAVLHRRESGQWLSVAQVQPVDTWVLSRVLATQDLRMRRVAV